MNASKISLIETSPQNVTLGTLARLARALNRRIKIDFVPVKKKSAEAARVGYKRGIKTVSR